MNASASSLLSDNIHLELEDVEKNIELKLSEEEISYSEAATHLIKLSIPS